MSKAQHTKGPWKVDDFGMYVVGADDSHVCQLGDYGEIKPWCEFENAKVNGPILAAAPAMALALDLIAYGLARIERSTTCPSLIEFCFDGLRYSLDGDWGRVLDVIGWKKASAAISQATSEASDA